MSFWSGRSGGMRAADSKLILIKTLVALGHGNDIYSSPSHDFEKLMRLFFHYSSKN